MKYFFFPPEVAAKSFAGLLDNEIKPRLINYLNTAKDYEDFRFALDHLYSCGRRFAGLVTELLNEDKIPSKYLTIVRGWPALKRF